MKMTPEHYAVLRDGIVLTLNDEVTRLKVDPAQPQTLKALVEFHAQAYVVEGNTRRMHFDLFWWANRRSSEIKAMIPEFYKYGNDDHLYTALKAIVKELRA